MKAMVPALIAAVTVLAAFGPAQAQQRYPDAFTANMRQHCLSSCSTNPQVKGRETSCSSFCSCFIDEAQRQLPLEVAMEAEKDHQAKQPNSPAVQRVRMVAGQCSGRHFPAAAQRR